MTDAENILANYRAIEARLAAAVGGGKTPEILPVTKTVPAERILCLREAGVRAVGENRVQEAAEKRPALEGDFQLHIIGRLQTNKAAQAAKMAAMVESLDRIELAQALEKALKAGEKRLEVLVQVNIGLDPAKGGIAPGEAEAFLLSLRAFEHLRVRGLMTVAPITETPEGARPYFRAMRALFDRLRADERFCGEMEILSMGMSADYVIAAEEGATQVRVGSALFGKRDYTAAR